jgi:hypothetical protein
MRNEILTLLILASPGACRTCPEAPDLSTPERTLDTFQRAFACDQKEIEFRCFSDSAKAGFHHLAGYAIGREIFRQENRVELIWLKLSDLTEHTRVTYDPGGNSATANIDTPNGGLLVELVNEPEYKLYHPDGTVTYEYADRITGEFAGTLQVAVSIADRDLRDFEHKPIQRVEIRSRWVIAGLPSLEQAQAASQQSNAP